MQPETLKSETVFRYSLLNFLTQGGLLVLALWGLPILANGLGEADFGVLSILWAFVGYFSLLDLGTSRAATKLVAEGLGRGDREKVHELVVAGLSLGVLIGCLTAAILFAISPSLSGLLAGNESPGTTLHAVLATAVGIPFMLVYGTASGVLAAFQLFPQLNALRAALGIFQWVGAALLIFNGYGVLEIIVFTVAVRIVLTAVSLMMVQRYIPGIYKNWKIWNTRKFKELLSFGGWVTVSQVISPLFFYVDRFIIGGVLSVSAVAFYTLPQEALSRLSIIPSSLTTTLFPVLSHDEVSGSSRVRDLYAHVGAVLFHTILPIVLFLIVFAAELLEVWVGSSYRVESTVVFQIIAAGYLFNSMAQVPVAGLHAAGRPDISAKFHLLELPATVIVSLLVIPAFGIVGAAVVWAVRVAVDSILLELAMRKVRGMSAFRRNLVWPTILFTLASFGILGFSSLQWRIALAILLLIAYVGLTWRLVLRREEKELLKSLLSSTG